MNTVWPVRAPGSMDGTRLVLIGLGVLSTCLLFLTVGVGLTVLGGKTSPVGFLRLVVVAASVSIATHLLATLRAWARR